MPLSKYSKKVWIPDVGSKPHQALVNFKFPYREFGKQKLVKRAFQHSWFAKWKWLHYEEDMDKAFCYNCIQAYKEDKLRASNLELAFIHLWEESLEYVKESEMRARILGVSDRMMKFDFFFGAILGETVLSHSDNLSRTLQKGDISASEGQGVAEMTVTCLKTLRTDDNFALFWSKVTKKATQLNIDEPALPRKRKRTVRYESGNAAPEFHTSIEGYYRQAYFEVLDVICSTIEDRFRQLGYQLYSNLEQLLLKAVCKENYSSEFDFVTKFYGPDLNVHALEMQLQIFATNFIMEGKKTSIKDILKYLRNISSAQRALLSEICIIAKLILVMPAANAVSERSFSALWRVKTYLRSTMKQTRLNHLMILHVHKDITDSLNLNDIGNEFVRCSEHRLSVFGHF